MSAQPFVVSDMQWVDDFSNVQPYSGKVTNQWEFLSQKIKPVYVAHIVIDYVNFVPKFWSDIF